MTRREVSAFGPADVGSADQPPTNTQGVLQEEQYRFPYHYLPTYDGTRFAQLQHWGWGYRYLGRLQVTLDLLGRLEYDSLIDIGCGDGRFLSEVRTRWPAKTLLGIDASAAAIAQARRMNPDIPVETRDIVRAPVNGPFDVATLLDVIEHVRPELLPAFVHAVARSLRPGGVLILTVPHKNERLVAKHYQHFDTATLRVLLAHDFVNPRFVPFDRRSRLANLLWKLVGGSGRYYVVTHPRITTGLFRYYCRRQLYAPDERTCLRIACIAEAARGSAARGE
jgi:SAM-dependent methyltransferase